MHVDVTDQLQRLSSNRNRKLSADQIDWNLNRAQQVLVETAVTPVEGSGRMQIKPGKNHIIQGLISGRTPLTAGWVTDRYITILPPDFWYLLDDGSSVSPICKGESKITSYEVVHITSVEFPFTTASAEYYKYVNLVYNNSSIFDMSSTLQDRQKQYQGLSSTDMHFYVKDLLLEQLQRLGILVYWENFYNVHAPYTLLFVSTTPVVAITLNLDGISYTGTSQDLTLEIHSTIRQSTFSPNTMVSPDKGMATGATPYFRTSYISPISELGPAILYTYVDKGFIVYGSTINYVRKPRMISLSLGTDCQLSPNVHQMLCDKTVEMVLNRISAQEPNWQEVAKQNAISNS